jgi:hypothetical protein
MSKKILFAVSFLAIIIGAIFVRTYHYNEWLFFKWDQARDAILLSSAIKDGPENLPLLGPRATKIGDDYLRLGPAYYYIQYLTGVVFDSTDPAIFAYSDLFFSIASILLLYLFLRVYFTQGISLLATTMYSFSFLVIQYSRFSWNPNSVPFFTLLTFYGLLRFSIARTFKSRLGWLSLWALGFAIASQYHFFAFFVLTGVSGLFLGYYFVITVFKDKIFRSRSQSLSPTSHDSVVAAFGKPWLHSLSYVGVVLIIFGFLYTPVIISDIKTQGSNTKLFFQMFGDSGREDKSFSEKLRRNFREQGDNYSLITTGFKHRSGMKNDPLTVGFGLFIILSGLLLIKRELSFKKETPPQRNFLILLLIWISVFFIITIPASYQLRPRYFVPVFPVPFIIIALWFTVLGNRIVKHYNLLIILITILVLGANFYGLNQWFYEQSQSQKENFKTYRTLILRHRDGVTLNQLEHVTDYLLGENTNFRRPLLYTSTTEYYLPFQYLLPHRNLKQPKLPIAIKKDISDLRDAEILYVINNGKNKSANKKLAPYLEEISIKQFGQLFVHKMQIIDKEKLDIAIISINEKKTAQIAPSNTNSEEKKTERLFWRDVFNN